MWLICLVKMQSLGTGCLRSPGQPVLLSLLSKVLNVTVKMGVVVGKRPAASPVHCLLLANVVTLFCDLIFLFLEDVYIF